MVDSVDLSNLARGVQSTSEHARVDVSGFSPTGVDEFLAGPTTQEITVTFYGSYGTGEVHATLEPIHSGREIVPIAWRHDMNTPTGVNNPELRGNVMLLTYNPGATRGDADTFDATFVAADAAGLTWSTTPGP
jgi:hypothetical protein